MIAFDPDVPNRSRCLKIAAITYNFHCKWTYKQISTLQHLRTCNFISGIKQSTEDGIQVQGFTKARYEFLDGKVVGRGFILSFIISIISVQETNHLVWMHHNLQESSPHIEHRNLETSPGPQTGDGIVCTWKTL